ncbi:MAG: hypothetical protein OXF79_27605 [Chloroflexi bacterium]|nr:hypothetical protein [Chloroflexota bacterium]
MNRDAWRVLREVQTAWTQAIHHVKQICQSSDVRPQMPAQVFTLDTNAADDYVKLSVGPVVFHVNERPSRPGPNLFIVVTGWMSFEGPNFKTLPFHTRDFGTEVAYFRVKQDRLEHIFAAHYDMDDSDYRHPVFHAQLASHMDSSEHVRSFFSQDREVTNNMNKVLRTVRIPTAQMDVFSVLIQVCADHLIGQQPAPSTTSAFEDLKTASSFFVGAGNRFEYLHTAPAPNCYRASHWYNT